MSTSRKHQPTTAKLSTALKTVREKSARYARSVRRWQRANCRIAGLVYDRCGFMLNQEALRSESISRDARAKSGDLQLLETSRLGRMFVTMLSISVAFGPPQEYVDFASMLRERACELTRMCILRSRPISAVPPDRVCDGASFRNPGSIVD